MPPGENVKGAVQPVAGSSGGIESLPDGVLQHILGFLPSPEAVRTCVLAQRWRHLWKAAPCLRVGCDLDQSESVEDLRSLVNHLLLLRGGSPLEACYFTFYAGRRSHDDVSHVNLWFRHVVQMCKVRVLTLFMFLLGEPWLELDNLPVISQHLRSLKLIGVQVHNSLLNFSSCPALEHLELSCCELPPSVKEIVSESLKHIIVIASMCGWDSRIHIYTPNLVSLHLENFQGRTPILERMPSLLKASVEITIQCRDRCTNANYFWTCDCESCDNSGSTANGSINCVLLRGLSEAKSLALRSASNMFIFKRDLRWCPMFTNLKTLLLNGYWYVPDDFHALACILERSPVLKKLTFEFCNEWCHKVEMKLRVSSMKRSAAISEHLEIVEIKCEVVDDRVLKVMKFLCAFNICFSLDKMETLE